MKLNAPKPLPLREIARLAETAERDSSLHVCRAGTPKLMLAPSGVNEIMHKGKVTKGIVPGLTLIPNAAAFTPPEFTTTNTVEKDGTRRRHYATVQPTKADDVV